MHLDRMILSTKKKMFVIINILMQLNIFIYVYQYMF